MTERDHPKAQQSLTEPPDSIKKQQLKRPIGLSSERIGLDDNTPAVLPVGTGGIPPESK